MLLWVLKSTFSNDFHSFHKLLDNNFLLEPNSYQNFNTNFKCEYDNNGEFIFAKQIGGTTNDKISSMAMDQHWNLYTTGNFMLCDTPNFTSNTLLLNCPNSVPIAVLGMS